MKDLLCCVFGRQLRKQKHTQENAGKYCCFVFSFQVSADRWNQNGAFVARLVERTRWSLNYRRQTHKTQDYTHPARQTTLFFSFLCFLIQRWYIYGDAEELLSNRPSTRRVTRTYTHSRSVQMTQSSFLFFVCIIQTREILQIYIIICAKDIL